MEKHRGEILKLKIHELGVPLSQVAERTGITRKTLYNWFERDDLPLEYMIKVGKAINYDFRPELPEFGSMVNEPAASYGTNWKDKYYSLLVENHDITQKYISLIDKKLKEYALTLI